MQYAFPDPAMNRLNYEGFVDCARKVIEILIVFCNFLKIFLFENWTGFYVGFYAYAVRTFLYGVTVINKIVI